MLCCWHQYIAFNALLGHHRGFLNRPAFAKLGMEVVSHALLPEQILDLREQFAKFDIRQTGEISASDMKNVLADTQNITLEDIQHIFQGVDLDGGHIISYHEFLAATISYKTITEQNLKTAFETMSHHNDFITRSDVENLLGMDSNEAEVEDMFKELNLSPSAKIDFQQVSWQ
jgi:Ca2+-binding EF-hand superfamily protein